MSTDSFDSASSDATNATRTTGTKGTPSASLGPYRLLQRLGEGGMGEVWLADQLRPVRRRVAIKVIKPGMDSAQIIARFEAERQALAVMEHPTIAKVFDGGTTPEGRPYFAMEYVPGEPITDFCDRQCLDIRARVELVIQLCEGVQHAHQKGIIQMRNSRCRARPALWGCRATGFAIQPPFARSWEVCSDEASGTSGKWRTFITFAIT